MNQEEKTKRSVTYNEDAVLCPGCKKRIRLNNSGRLRVHIAGKIGSGKCLYSDWDPDYKASDLIHAENMISPEDKDGTLLTLTFSDHSK